MGCVYVITNKVNGKQYVGKTIEGVEARWREHCLSAKRGSLHGIHRAIRKYGADAFVVEVLETSEDNNFLLEREVYWIATLETYKRGYNMTPGGEGLTGQSGRPHTQETRRKLSAAVKRWLSENPHPNLGRKFGPTPEIVKWKLSASHRGKTISPETREKMREANRATWSREEIKAKSSRPTSEETKEKQRMSNLATWARKRGEK